MGRHVYYSGFDPPISRVPSIKDTIAKSFSQQVKSIGTSKGSRVRFVEIYPLLNKDTDLYDGLHPNDKGYQKIGNAILPTLRGLATDLCTVWRFRGYTYQGASGDASKGLPNVTLNLYGYNEGEQAPGTLIDTRISDGAGFYNFISRAIMSGTTSCYKLKTRRI